jgi:hypothetical protein
VLAGSRQVLYHRARDLWKACCKRGWIEQRHQGPKNEVFFPVDRKGLGGQEVTRSDRKVNGQALAEGESKMKLGPRPAGRPWTPADDAQLLALLDLKMDRALIARKLKRTVSAIGPRRRILNKRRLVELGLKAKK